MSKYAIDENKPHLGGNFPNGDPATWCPSAWKFLIDKYQIKTAFVKSLKSKKMNKKVLGEFVELVA